MCRPGRRIDAARRTNVRTVARIGAQRSGTPRSCADVAAGLSAGNRTASWHGRFVRKVPTDPAGPLAAAHTRAAETHSCGRFRSAAEGGRMRYSGDGRALVPRTDSSVRTSVPVGARAGRRRRARVDFGRGPCARAASSTDAISPSQRHSSPPRVCAVGEARRARQALTGGGATRASQCQWDIRCLRRITPCRTARVAMVDDRASRCLSRRKPSRRSIAARPAICIGMKRRARLSDVYITTLAFKLATGARGFESCSF